MKNRLLKGTIVAAAILYGGVLQSQDYEGWFGGNFMLQSALDARKGYCLDLEGYATITDTSAPVIVHSCKEGLWKDGTWRVDYPAPGQIYLPEYELCVAAQSPEDDARVVLQDCSDSPLQRFLFRDDGRVELQASSAAPLCLAVGETSRPTGGNLRRDTSFTHCDNTPEARTQWVLPGEDVVYPAIMYEPSVVTVAAGGPPGGGPGPNLYVGACSPCHAPSGIGYQSEFAPKISGQEDWYLARQLSNFQMGLRGRHDGERWAAQMRSHSEDFTQAQLDGFVDYVLALDDVPAPITISGDVNRGKQLYEATCSACHGPEAMGNETLHSPRLAGMSDWYMVIQLAKFRAGLRGDHPQDSIGQQMVIFAQVLPDEQALTDVVAYINSLVPR